MRRTGHKCHVIASGIVLLALSACDDAALPQHADMPDPATGSRLIGDFGCGACHIVDGVRAAKGKLAPPLSHFASRGFIAGRLPNTRENLVRWLMNPAAIDGRTAMPDLDLTEAQARHIAAYLYTLD